MRGLSLVAAAVIALGLSSAARADGRTLGQFIDGCHSDPITCILDMQDAIVAAETDAGVSCPPDGVTDREAKAALTWMQDRLQANPKLAQAPVADMQLQAAQTLWPCK